MKAEIEKARVDQDTITMNIVELKIATAQIPGEFYHVSSISLQLLNKVSKGMRGATSFDYSSQSRFPRFGEHSVAEGYETVYVSPEQAYPWT